MLRFSGPAGLVAAAATFAAYALVRAGGVDLDEARTTATLVLVSIGLWILVILARPMTQWRRLLVVSMSGLGATAVLVPEARAFFALDFPSWEILGEAAVVAASAVALIEAGWRASHWRHRRADHDGRHS